MRLVIILLIASMLQVSAASFGQRVTLNQKRITLDEVFREIRKQTGYNVLLITNKINTADKINADFKSKPLNDVLSQILSKAGLTYTIVDKTIVIRENYEHENREIADTAKQTKLLTVTGKITDAIGNAIPGVTIRIKGEPHGTISDMVGHYSIKVNPTDSLQFRMVGYVTQTFSAKNRVTLDVQLEAQENSLNEVVVTGYGQKQTSVSVTGAVSTVRTKELKQSPVANLSNALAGRLPGLTAIQSSGLPGSDAATIYIRGVSTYSGSQTPLIVIDGLPRGDANFGDIDVNEVESISILKDASSTSLYGIQGANGVILITTKRGRSGKPNIQLNAQMSEQQPTSLPQYLDTYRSAVLDNESAANDGLSPIWTSTQLNIMKNKLDPYTYPDVNWYNVVLKPWAPQQQYNINITGGNEGVTYFVSGSYLRQGSLLRDADNNQYGVADKYDRYNFRSNINVNVTQSLKLRLDLATRLEDRQGPGAGYGWIFAMLSEYNRGTTPVYNPDGTYAAGNQMPTDWSNILGSEKASGYYQNYWTSTNGTVEATQNFDFITPGLKAKALFTFENYGAINQSETQKFDSYRFSQDPVTGIQTYRVFSQATPLSASYSTSATRYYYYNLELTYNRKFGKNTFGGMILGNRNFQSVAADLPHVYQGLVGQATYNYDERYFLEFNAGYNGSENFPPGKRYGFFPAISGGWVISNEDFFKNNVQFMDYFKLRGSYGIVGNDQIGGSRWLFLSTYGPAGGTILGATPYNTSGYAETSLGNSNVTWEKSQKADLGIETGFLKDALKLKVDLFHELRSNILTNPLTIPTYLGLTAVKPINLGKVRNQGLEVELNVNTHIGQKVDVFANLNYSLAKNIILEADEPQLPYSYQYVKGNPIGYVLGYKAIGLFQSQAQINAAAKQPFAANGTPIPGDIQYKDMNGDGVINASDRVMIPNNNFPTQIVGGSFGVSYHGFDASVLFQGALGGYANYGGYLLPGQYQYRPYQWDNRWTPATAATATLPALHKNQSNNDQTSTFWLRSTDYLKLRNFEIGYTLPNAWVKKLDFNKVRIFVNGQNLVTWDKLPIKDVDPEINPQGSVGVPYPIERIINCGIQANF